MVAGGFGAECSDANPGPLWPLGKQRPCQDNVRCCFCTFWRSHLERVLAPNVIAQPPMAVGERAGPGGLAAPPAGGNGGAQGAQGERASGRCLLPPLGWRRRGRSDCNAHDMEHGPDVQGAAWTPTRRAIWLGSTGATRQCALECEQGGGGAGEPSLDVLQAVADVLGAPLPTTRPEVRVRVYSTAFALLEERRE